MQEQLKRAGQPGPEVIDIAEGSIRKGYTSRMVARDLLTQRLIWFGRGDRSERSITLFFASLGKKKSDKIRSAVMDIWKSFLDLTQKYAPQSAILYDKYNV